MLTGENGLLTKVSNAKEKMKIGELKEEIKLAITEEQIRANTGENLGNVFKYGNVWNDLRKKDEKLEVTENTTDSSHTILYKGYYFKIDKDKNVIYIGEAGPEPEETEYTIVYNKNDGSEEKLEQIVEKGTETTLDTSKFTRDGYKIEGWYTNAECTGEKITKTDSNIEVYAKWVELTTIESKGSTTIGDITTNTSAKISYCHNVGTLSDSKPNKGTMVGCKNGTYTGSNNYWLEACNASYSVGSNSTVGNKYTAAKMKVQSNFSGWDFTNIWQMDTTKGYPVLQ